RSTEAFCTARSPRKMARADAAVPPSRCTGGARPNRNPCICRGFLSRPVSRILFVVTIHLCSNPVPRRAACWRDLFALHRTGFGLPPCRHDAGGLLPHLFTLTFSVSGESLPAVSFLCHFPSAFAAWVAPASCPAVSGLSSSREARGHPACESNCSCVCSEPASTRSVALHSGHVISPPACSTNSPQ